MAARMPRRALAGWVILPDSKQRNAVSDAARLCSESATESSAANQATWPISLASIAASNGARRSSAILMIIPAAIGMAHEGVGSTKKNSAARAEGGSMIGVQAAGLKLTCDDGIVDRKRRLNCLVEL